MVQIVIKTPEQIELMRTAGKLLASVFDRLDEFAKPGVSTMAINDFVHKLIVEELESRPASLGQYGYKYVLNISPNKVVCHGMPDAKAIIKDSDMFNVDITLEKNGYIADSSKMYLMPKAPKEARELSLVTYQAMWEGIKTVKPGSTLGDIGYAIASHARRYGFSVVKEYCGHGIGQEMHEAPEVLHFGSPGKGLTLREGMTFTIEPMINQGTARTKELKDKWTVVTRDGKLSAQWEHTIAVTAEGFEVLTLRGDEEEPE